MAGNKYTSQSAPFSFKKNAGGLNSTFSPTSLEDNESSSLQNIDFDKSGAIKKRGGYTQLNTTAFNGGAAWNGLYWFEKSNGNNYLIGTCGNKIGESVTLVQGATPFTDRTGAVTITAGNNNHVSWATHLDTVLGTNNVDAPFQLTGGVGATAMTGPTGLTKAKFVTVFSNHTFFLNVTVSGTAHKSRLYWSTIDSISSWDSSAFRDLGRNNGQEITGVAVLGETLVVMKNRQIWNGSFTGDSDVPFIFRLSRSTVGCIAGGSVQEVDNGVVFEAADGFYFYDGNNSYKLSDRITATIDTFNYNRLQNSVSVYYASKNRYISSQTLSGGSTHTRQLTWDSFNNAWSIYKGLNANCFARVYSSGQERIYFGDYSGFVYLMDTGSTDMPSGTPTAIDAYYYTKWFDYGDLINKKANPIVKIYYQYASTILTFAYSYNFISGDQYSQTFSMSNNGAVYGTAVYGVDIYGGTGGAVERRDMTGRGEVVRYGFKNSTIGEGFTIDAHGAFPNTETYK